MAGSLGASSRVLAVLVLGLPTAGVAAQPVSPPPPGPTAAAAASSSSSFPAPSPAPAPDPTSAPTPAPTPPAANAPLAAKPDQPGRDAARPDTSEPGPNEDRADAIARDVALHPPQKPVKPRQAFRLLTQGFKLGSLLDRSVRSSENSEVGRVIDVLIGVDGKPTALELDVGGFLGLGNRRIAVAWNLFDLSHPDGTAPLRVALNGAEVRSAPATDAPDKATVVMGAEAVAGTPPPPSAPAPASGTVAPVPAAPPGTEPAPETPPPPSAVPSSPAAPPAASPPKPGAVPAPTSTAAPAPAPDAAPARTPDAAPARTPGQPEH
ncbi:MAG: PRC-barrel domain-containing protein [Gluconacetobacter diazotrophicus]|nr:PRC-barrel domain-containing protein [Gluconacetobacter diazotrophicus]